MAVDCLLAHPTERLLTRKLLLKSCIPAAEFNPQETPKKQSLKVDRV
jgi:hypothetical protein